MFCISTIARQRRNVFNFKRKIEDHFRGIAILTTVSGTLRYRSIT